MKIEGLTPEEIGDEGEVTLPRRKGDDITLRLRGVPMGFDEKLDFGPPPQAPMRGFARDAKGKLLRDPDTTKPVPVRDEADAAYVKALRLRNRLSTMALVHFALGADDRVGWDAKREDCSTDAEFYGKLHAEFLAMGFAVGDYGLIVDEVLRLSNIGQDQIDKTKEAFTRAAALA